MHGNREPEHDEVQKASAGSMRVIFIPLSWVYWVWLKSAPGMMKVDDASNSQRTKWVEWTCCGMVWVVISVHKIQIFDELL